MRIGVWTYQLKPLMSLNAKVTSDVRAGALLRISHQDVFGYADLFPWGSDLPVADQLRAFQQGNPTDLFRRSLELALRDAEARAQKRALLPDPGILNNALMTEWGPQSLAQIQDFEAQGFQVCKLKCGRNPEQEARELESFIQASSLRFRLDFNSGPVEQVVRFQKCFSRDFDSKIEYVEDPCPYDPIIWSQLQERWTLALDFETASVLSTPGAVAAKVVILKPARPEFHRHLQWAQERGLRWTITSMMDHPVGVIHAASWAAELGHVTAGCLTHQVYEPNDFSESLRVSGPRLQGSPGVGVGFDSILKETPWTELEMKS